MKKVIKSMNSKKISVKTALICGMLGCICFGAGDWLMIYGAIQHTGELYWLTDGVASIPYWRNTLALTLSFPGIILYGIALLSISLHITEHRPRKIYKTLTIYGMTPWIALHLFYIMILYLYAWLNQNGFTSSANAICGELYHYFSWFILASEVLMTAPYLYLAYLIGKGRSIYSKKTSIVNPLFIYLLLYLVKTTLPDSAFRIGFTNGLMSESMFLWFSYLLWININKNKK